MERILRIFAVDLCPQNNRFAIWRSPLGVLVGVAAAALVCSLFASSNGVVVAVALLAVAAVGVVWPWVTIWGVRATVSFARSRGREGERCPVQVEVVNRWPWPAWGLAIELGCEVGAVEYTPAPGQPARPADLLAAAVGPFGKRTLEGEIRPNCRGEYPRRAPVVRCGFPFGIWHASRRATVARPLLVWPAAAPTREIADGGERPLSGDVLQQKIGTSGETLGVREYRRGDPLSRLHWKQTAKHGRLIVRELQSQTAPWIQLLIDVDARAHVGAAPGGTLEAALRLAAGFAESAWQRGTGVELVTQHGVVAGSHTAILDALARTPTAPCQPFGEWAVACAHLRRGQASRLAIVTDRSHPPEGLGRALPAMRSVLLETDANAARPAWWTIEPNVEFRRTRVQETVHAFGA